MSSFFLIKYLKTEIICKFTPLRFQGVKLREDMKSFSNLFQFRSSPQMCFYKKMFWKYSEDLLENSYAWSAHPTLLKLHFGMGVLLKICCIFSQHLFLRALGKAASVNWEINFKKWEKICLRRAYTMKFFFYRWLNFSFDSFLSTFNTCIQLPNAHEIFQSAIMKVFQKKKFLPDF